MKNQVSTWALRMMLVVAFFWGLSVPVAGQKYEQLAGCLDEPAEFHRCALPKTKTFDPPRTPDGKPDFQGYWIRAGVFGTDDIEEHLPGHSGDPGGKSQVVDPADGKIPYKPWAAAEQDAYFTTYSDPIGLCFMPGAPRQLYSPGFNQILQTRDSLIFLNDMTHAYRVIPTNARPPLGKGSSLYMGSSRGRWEGNTLVVEVTGQKANWFDHMGNFYSDGVHVIERWTMIGADAIHYEARITDPNVYTRPWTMAFGLRRRPAEPGYFTYENACHEGNQMRVPGSLVGDLKPYFGTKIPN